MTFVARDIFVSWRGSEADAGAHVSTLGGSKDQTPAHQQCDGPAACAARQACRAACEAQGPIIGVGAHAGAGGRLSTASDVWQARWSDVTVTASTAGCTGASIPLDAMRPELPETPLRALRIAYIAAQTAAILEAARAALWLCVERAPPVNARNVSLPGGET